MFSKIRLFGDDCLLYSIVEVVEDECKLQRGLHEIESWSDRWQVSFNIKKCHLLSIRKRGNDVNSLYTLKGVALESVEHHPYLRIELQSNLKWNYRIEKIRT